MTLTDSQRWFLLASLVLLGWLLYLLAPVLTPFLVAGLFAYLNDPLADRLEAWGLSRTLAVVTIFVLMGLGLALLLLILLPLAEQQLRLLAQSLPGYLAWIDQHLLPLLRERFGLAPDQLDLALVRDWLGGNWAQAGGLAAGALRRLGHSGAWIATWVANLLLIPVVTFYLLRDWDRFIAAIDHLLPRELEPVIARLAREADEVLSAFIRGQLMVMLALGVVYSLGLTLVGLKFALLVGMAAGLVSFVPYLGFLVGIVVASLAMFFQTHDLGALWPVWLVFGVGQVLEGAVFTPLLVGDRIGLHPVTVIFAVLAGGQLFGFFGVLLALPVAAVLAVIVRHLQQRYLSSRIYGAQTVAGGEEGDGRGGSA